MPSSRTKALRLFLQKGKGKGRGPKVIFTRQLGPRRVFDEKNGPRWARWARWNRNSRDPGVFNHLRLLARAISSSRCAFSVVAFGIGRTNSKGARPTRGLAQRKLTVSSPPGLLCDRSFSNGGSVPDGREAVHTPAKPSPRRRPSCFAVPRETHPAALQQTKPCLWCTVALRNIALLV